MSELRCGCEPVIRFGGEQDWLYVAVDPESNDL
jgi:transposase-like protein